MVVDMDKAEGLQAAFAMVFANKVCQAVSPEAGFKENNQWWMRVRVVIARRAWPVKIGEPRGAASKGAESWPRVPPRVLARPLAASRSVFPGRRRSGRWWG